MSKVPCIVDGCTCTAEISQGKRRLILKCPECGPLNFQTLAGQKTLKAWLEKHCPDEFQNSPDSTTAETEPAPPKKARKSLFPFGVRG